MSSVDFLPFIPFTQSEAGFWVDQWYDERLEEWVIEDRPIVWADRQRRALEYLLDLDRRGRIKYNNILWIDIGKTAKTLLSAAVADWLGRHVMKDAELAFAANSKDQADARAFQTLKDSLDRNPHLADFGEIVGRDVLSSTLVRYYKTGNRAFPVATKSKSQAGKNTVFIGIDEFHGWVGDGSRALYAELKPSPTRNISIVFQTSYPGMIEDDGPLNDKLDATFDRDEQPVEGWEKVEGLEDLPLWVKDNQAIWWNHEPYDWHTRTMPSGKSFLEELEGDESLIKGEFLRIWRAIRTQRTEVFLPVDFWDQCKDEEWSGLTSLDRGVPLVGAIDVGVKFDSTAVIWRGYDTATGKYLLMEHKIMSPDRIAATDDKDVFQWIKQHVLDMVRRQNVLAIYYDPWQMYQLAGELRREKIEMKEITQQSGRTKADTDYRSLIIQGKLRNYKHATDLRTHVKQAIGREVGQGAIRLDKNMTTQVIDGAVADSMCCLAVTDHIEEFVKVERARRAPKRALQRRGAGNVRAIYRMGEGFRG